MKRITTLFLILGVILVFSGCATLDNLFGPKYGEFTLHLDDGTQYTYLLPPEFPEFNEDELDYIPIYWGRSICLRQVIGEDKYGIFLVGQNARIVGAGMIVNGKETYWIYDAEGKPLEMTCTDEELDAHIQVESMPPAVQGQDT